MNKTSLNWCSDVYAACGDNNLKCDSVSEIGSRNSPSTVSQNNPIIREKSLLSHDATTTKRCVADDLSFQPLPKKVKRGEVYFSQSVPIAKESRASSSISSEQSAVSTVSGVDLHGSGDDFLDPEHLSNPHDPESQSGAPENQREESSYAFPNITDLLTVPTPDESVKNARSDGGPLSSANYSQPKGSTGHNVCSVCQKSFRTKLLLTQHKDTHDPNKTHRCPYPGCERAFRSQKYLGNHINDQHRTSSSYQCSHPGCKFVTNKKIDLKRHVAANHKAVRQSQNPVTSPSHLPPSNPPMSEIAESPDGNKAHNSFFDEDYQDCIDIMMRNVKEIYLYHSRVDASASVASPSAQPGLDMNVTLPCEHLSPDTTSSTLSAPSFSNGAATFPGNSGPSPGGSTQFCPSPVSSQRSVQQQPSLPAPQTPYYPEVFSNSGQWPSAGYSNDSFGTSIQPHGALLCSAGPYGRDRNEFPPELGYVRNPPQAQRTWDPACQFGGSCNGNPQRSYIAQGNQQHPMTYHNNSEPMASRPVASYYQNDRQQQYRNNQTLQQRQMISGPYRNSFGPVPPPINMLSGTGYYQEGYQHNQPYHYYQEPSQSQWVVESQQHSTEPSQRQQSLYEAPQAQTSNLHHNHSWDADCGYYQQPLQPQSYNSGGRMNGNTMPTAVFQHPSSNTGTTSMSYNHLDY